MKGDLRHIHVEGDIWTDQGKTWTIKDGIKMSISSKDDLRSDLLLPLCCPECGQSMHLQLDEKMWYIHRACFDCVVKFETKLRLHGLYEEYERKMVNGNIVSTLRDLKHEMQEFLVQKEADVFITEDGQVEEWVTDQASVRREIEKQIEHTDRLIGEHESERSS